MRHLSLFLCVFLFIASCKKATTSRFDDQPPVPDLLKQFLRKTVSDTDLVKLNFKNGILIKYDSGRINLWQIPFADRPIGTDFVLVRSDAQGNSMDGRIVHIEQDAGNSLQFNGSVRISSLDRQHFLSSAVVNGYMSVLHNTVNGPVFTGGGKQTMSIPASDGAEVLPDVLVVGYINSASGSVSLSTYMRLLTIMATSPDGAAGGSGGGSNGGGAGTSAPGAPSDGSSGRGASASLANLYSPLDPNAAGASPNPIEVDFEYGPTNPAISLTAFINCFASIPDNRNTTYAITIMTDIPVDSNPSYLFSFATGSPGHAFLKLTKQNGNQSVTQNIGFYPNASFKNLLDCKPVPGKFVDNGRHEYNASLTMNVTGPKFQDALNSLSSMATAQYDIDEYNCTDLAMQAFNAARTGTPLSIPMFHIPGSPVASSKTPQGLYLELDFLRKTNAQEATNIVTGSAKFYAGSSHGPCN